MLRFLLGVVHKVSPKCFADGERAKKLAAYIVLFGNPNHRSSFNERVIGFIKGKQDKEFSTDFELGWAIDLQTNTILGNIDHRQLAPGVSGGQAHVFAAEIAILAKIPPEL